MDSLLNILEVLDIIAIGIIAFLVYKLEPIENCEHKNTFIYVDAVVVTCETTTITCLDCGERLSTKTDCR